MHPDEALPAPHPGSAGHADNAGFIEGPAGFYIPREVTAEAVHDVFNRMVSTRAGTPTDWYYRSHVLKIAKQCFGDFRRWMQINAKEALFYGRRMDFMHDTLSFITTGRRRISVRNWFDLLEAHPPLRRDLVRRDALSQFNVYDTLNWGSTADIIADWCAQPNGFDDMLCTLNILFGLPKDVTAS